MGIIDADIPTPPACNDDQTDVLASDFCGCNGGAFCDQFDFTLADDVQVGHVMPYVHMHHGLGVPLSNLVTLCCGFSGDGAIIVELDVPEVEECWWWVPSGLCSAYQAVVFVYEVIWGDSIHSFGSELHEDPPGEMACHAMVNYRCSLAH